MHLVCQLAYMNTMPVCLVSMQLVHRRPGEYTACTRLMTAQLPCSVKCWALFCADLSSLSPAYPALHPYAFHGDVVYESSPLYGRHSHIQTPSPVCL